MPTFEDFRRMTDPRKMLEAFMGSIGGLFGNPYGAYGQFAQYTPKAFFDSGDYYTAEGVYDAKTYLREAIR